jgi:hypothetical protein
VRHNDLADIPQLTQRTPRPRTNREQDLLWVQIGALIGTVMVAVLYGIALWRMA